MIERQNYPPHYHVLRHLLTQLATFATAVYQELDSESPLRVPSEYARWMAQAQAAQQLYCERCGAHFITDLLGPEAYAVDAFQRICAACYAELVRSIGRPTRRLARLTVVAQEHPELMASCVVQAQRSHQLSDPELQHCLGINAIGVLSLALCPQTRTGDAEEENITSLAASAGCTTTMVRAILAESRNTAVARSPAGKSAPESMRSLDQDAAMDRVALYHKVVRAIVERIAAVPSADQPNVELLFICDAERGHYIHMTAGWHNHYPMYGMILHVRIKDDKIVIEHDGTDTFGDELRAAGVPKDDIVFVFLQPELAI